MVDVTTTCRDISELTGIAQTACRLLFQECFKAGIKDIFITETYRSQERQAYLYAQGRTRLYDSKGNKLPVVTWTLDSNHKSRRAWDIAVAPPKDLYHIDTLSKVGAIARKLGITWGGDWKGNIDRPHFEIPTNWKMPVGYNLEGEIVIPSNSKLKVQLIVKDKEEVKMVQSFNPGSPAMITETDNYLSEAVSEGLIDKSHLETLRKNEMTSDRLLGLYITVEQRRRKKARGDK